MRKRLSSVLMPLLAVAGLVSWSTADAQAPASATEPQAAPLTAEAVGAWIDFMPVLFALGAIARALVLKGSPQ